jgi:hypothetical protein
MDDSVTVEGYYRQALLVEGWEDEKPRAADVAFSCCNPNYRFNVNITSVASDANLTEVLVEFTYRP